MTVEKTLENALALTLESPADNTDFADFTLSHFNLMLVELLDINNQARARKNKEPFVYAPILENITDENPYEQELWGAMVYGLAAKLLTADESDLAGTYLQQYYALVTSALPTQNSKVVDIYASNTD